MTLLTLRVLGPLQVAIADTPILRLESDRARALLAYLAVEADRSHRREALIGLLWPDCSEKAARHNLRQALFNVRQAIGDHAASPPYLLITRDEIQFNAASDYTLDVAQFNTLFTTCDKHLPRCLEDCPIRAERLAQVVELYRGKFLEQFFLADSSEFEEWALVQREALHQRALDALAYLANYHEQHGDYELARRHTARQLELDPWREEAHRQMMRILAQSGQTSAALKQYETCRRVLSDELGVEPSPETRELYEQILDGKWKPLRTSIVQHRTSNLPTHLTPFVGRAREQADLAQMLSNSECRLLTLVGPGGIGKTRLALQVGASRRQMFAEGVAFIPLVSVNSVESIVPAIAAALGLTSHSQDDPKIQLLDLLREKEMLLIMDNAEHLLDGAGLFVEILQHAPGIKVLVTSRESLNLREEWAYEVKGLALPASEVENIEGSDAVALFVQCARRAHAGFRLTDGDRAAAVRLCQLVEGVPLGIELAAAWMRTLELAEIVREIERSLDFLNATWRDLPERHRSLRAVFDHSWNMLSPEEQTTLSRLTPFHGGFHRQAAEQVAQASLPVLASLVAKSIIHRRGGAQSARSSPFGRYEMHELIRHYAEERMVECGQCDAACQAHFHYFLRFAEEAEPQLTGPAQVTWLNRLDEEHDNLRAALEWSLKPIEPIDAVLAQESLRLVGALYLFWKRRDHWSEGRAWLKRALSRSNHLPGTKAKAKALNGAVLLAVEQADTQAAQSLAEENLLLSNDLGDPDRIASALNSHGYLLWKQKKLSDARVECTKALALLRQLDDRFNMAEALHNLGHITINQNDLLAAQKFLEESVSICREIGDMLGMNSAIGDQGLVAYLQGQDATARSLLEQALSGAREIGSVPTSVAAMNRLGDLARVRGDYDEAGKLYAECLELYRRMGDKDEFPSLLHNLGYVEKARGNHTRALALFREALGVQREMENHAGIAECLEGIAAVLTETGKPEQGARLLGAAEQLRGRVGATLWPANRIEHDRNLALLDSTLDAAALAAAWAEGRQMASESFSFDTLFL